MRSQRLRQRIEFNDHDSLLDAGFIDLCGHAAHQKTPAVGLHRGWCDGGVSCKGFGFVDRAVADNPVGFGHGIAEDGAVIGKFVAAGLNFFVSTSFSKSFSLYGERVGALSVVCADKEECGRVLSQLKIVIRTNYSNPPIHGGAVVAAVLANPEWRATWEKELGEMRVRIKAMRQKLVDGLKAAGVKQDMSFITTQIGMFSYSGLNKDKMVRLRSEFGVYGTDTGRMCVAALNSKNIDYVCQSIAKVV